MLVVLVVVVVVVVPVLTLVLALALALVLALVLVLELLLLLLLLGRRRRRRRRRSCGRAFVEWTGPGKHNSRYPSVIQASMPNYVEVLLRWDLFHDTVDGQSPASF